MSSKEKKKLKKQQEELARRRKKELEARYKKAAKAQKARSRGAVSERANPLSFIFRSIDELEWRRRWDGRGWARA